MRPLASVLPTPEQLAILSRNKPGIEIIRGAAGSGKTTTALLRLRSLIGSFVSRKARQQTKEPVRILVLTYNRTLRGYIANLAEQQAAQTETIQLEIYTFSKWAMTVLNNPPVIDDRQRRNHILGLASGIPLSSDFLLREVEYVMGRFLPERLADYLAARRDGRGVSPRVDRPMRELLIRQVIEPYQALIDQQGIWDWNDLAVKLAKEQVCPPYDVVIADETQDFSANQIRAIINHLAPLHSVTFVTDTAQRIYARGFTWQEAGVTVRPDNVRRLTRNYRNTIEIARFTIPLLRGVPIDDDGTIPDFAQCTRHGPVPIVLCGLFSKQADFVTRYIKDKVDLATESVAILHPVGWFDAAKCALARANLDFVDITRQSEWPPCHQHIAFSTLHSSKGLEFDHVIIIGLNDTVTPHGPEEDDDRLINLRRLLAMGIGRARKSVVLGYKPAEASHLVTYLDPDTFQRVDV